MHVYDLLIPLQCLKCARIVRNSSKLKKLKNGSVKTFRLDFNFLFVCLFFFEKGRRVGKCASDGGQISPTIVAFVLKSGGQEKSSKI